MGRALGESLRDAGIRDVVMLSGGNTARTRVLKELLGTSVSVENRTGGTSRELTFPEYIDLCRIFGVSPSSLGYQHLTTASKIDMRVTEDELAHGDGLVVIADTVIHAGRLRPLEKPDSPLDAYRQLYELVIGGMPYLVTTMVMVSGMGMYRHVQSRAAHSLPVRQAPTDPGGKMREMFRHYVAKQSPLVPGVVSHTVSEFVDGVVIYETADPRTALEIDPAHFFHRRSQRPDLIDVWGMSGHFNGFGGAMWRELQSGPTLFTPREYDENDPEVTNLFLGAPALAYTQALMGALDQISAGTLLFSTPRRKLDAARRYIRSLRS